MQAVHESLIALQDLDRSIDEAREKLAAFEPRLEELESPVLVLEKEITETRKSLENMQGETRRLERGADEKRARLGRYEERLMRVRDEREAAAANAELDLIKRALDADEQEALQFMDQARRAELRLDELEEKRSEAEESLNPQREALLAERGEVEREIAALETRRDEQISGLDDRIRQMYERVRGGRTGTAVAELTPDGACGHCFSIVPLQRQAEIRRSGALIRCEVCGVILYSDSE